MQMQRSPNRKEVVLRGEITASKLIHPLIDSVEKIDIFKQHDIALGQLEIEIQKSSDRENQWEHLAKMWNNNNFGPTTEELQDLHSDFPASYTIAF